MTAGTQDCNLAVQMNLSHAAAARPGRMVLDDSAIDTGASFSADGTRIPDRARAPTTAGEAIPLYPSDTARVVPFAPFRESSIAVCEVQRPCGHDLVGRELALDSGECRETGNCG
jgi:hypothetical protein